MVTDELNPSINLKAAPLKRRGSRRKSFSITVTISLIFAWLMSWSTLTAQIPTSDSTVEPSSSASFDAFFQVDPEQYGSVAGGNVFRVEPESPLQFHLSVVHGFPDQEKRFRLFMLLDYEPLSFTIDTVNGAEALLVGTPAASAQRRTTIDLVLPRDKEQTFAFETAEVGAGYHDLALVFVPDPDQGQGDLAYWTTFRPAIRASVYAGRGAVPPSLRFQPLDPAPVANAGYSELALFDTLTDSEESWQGGKVERGGSLNGILRLIPYTESSFNASPTDDDRVVPVALVAFMGDRVVPLNGEPYLLATLEEGHENVVPIEVRAPDKQGSYQYFIQQFPHPFLDVDAASDSGRWLFAIQPQRLTIEVEPAA